MNANQFGNCLKLTTFGESHGLAMGAVISGCPAGVNFDLSDLNYQLQRRRPGLSQNLHSSITSGRDEEDSVEILSGIYQGKTLGTPIAIIIRNRNAKSEDYDLSLIHI